MSFMKLTKSEVEGFTQSSGGQPIVSTGIYDITIDHVEADIKEVDGNKVRSLNIRYTRNDTGGKGYLFNIRLDMNNGKPHFQMEHIQHLMYILKIQELKDPTKETIQLNNGTKEILSLKEFKGKRIKVLVIAEYSRYNGKIYKKLVPYQFYDADTNATAYELSHKDETKYGRKYELDSKKTEYMLRDGVTPEDVAAYEASSGGSNSDENKQTKPSTNIPEINISEDEIPF